MCEDFCGTAKLCREWLRLDTAEERSACGVDNDDEVLRHARALLARCDSEDRRRIRLFSLDVLSAVSDELEEQFEIVCALNHR